MEFPNYIHNSVVNFKTENRTAAPNFSVKIIKNGMNAEWQLKLIETCFLHDLFL